MCTNMFLNTLVKREKLTSYFDLSLTFAYVHHCSNTIIKQRRLALAFVFDSEDDDDHSPSVCVNPIVSIGQNI